MNHQHPGIPASQVERASIGSAAASAAPVTPVEILLVERDARDARLIGDLLSESGAGYALVHIDRLSLAVDEIQQRRFAAILLDLSLPESPGLDALRQVRNITSETPLIVVCGVSDDALAVQSLQAGAQDYLVKGHLDGYWLMHTLQNAIERMRSEQTLRASETRYRLLAENITDVVCTLDLNGRVIDVSPSITRVLGYSVDEALAMPLEQILTPASLAPLAQSPVLPDMNDPLWSQRFELEATHKDGHNVWVEVELGFLRSNVCSPCGILAVGRDITGRKQAEAERVQGLARANLYAESLREKDALEARVAERTAQLSAAYERLERELAERKRITEALQESEWYARSIIESSLDMIISADNEQRIVEFNPAAQETFGYTPDEVQGQSIALLYADPLEGQVVHSNARAKGKVITEVSARRKNGDVFPQLVSTSIMRSAQGDVLGTVGVSRDITEQKRLEEALRSLSLIDDLTGLYNRRGFLTLAEQRWKVAGRIGRHFSLIFIDLDGLKKINDSFGHFEGDAVLRLMGDTLRSSFRRTDILARLSGDEFIVMAVDADSARAEMLAARLLSNVQSANEKGDGRYAISCSIGTATYDPATPAPMMALMGQADRAMYEQKRLKANKQG